MKARIIEFRNASRYKEYAIQIKKGLFKKWEWHLDPKGTPALMSKAEAESVVAKYTYQ